MKFLTSIFLIFLITACNEADKKEVIAFQQIIPDSTKGIYGMEFYNSFQEMRRTESKLQLKDLSKGSPKFELRLWHQSGSFDPQTLFVLNQTDNGDWLLKELLYSARAGDSLISEKQVSIPDSRIRVANLEEYWSIRSQSDLPDGDKYGCLDGSTDFLELSDSLKYKFAGYICPFVHKNKDTAFAQILNLSELLRGWFSEFTFYAGIAKEGVQPSLNIPFGQIAKLDVEVYDGNLAQTKALSGRRLLKIFSIDDVALKDKLLLPAQQENMISNFPFGKKLMISGYETGSYQGIKADKNTPISAGVDYHFESALAITKIDSAN